jgi:hypothetical protein
LTSVSKRTIFEVLAGPTLSLARRHTALQSICASFV